MPGVSGGEDVIHPPSTVAATTRRLGGEVRLFPTMGHALPLEPGWQDVAATCLEWLASVE